MASMRRSRFSSASRMSTRAGSAESGLSVGGEVMLQLAAETDALHAVVSEGAGVRSVREAVYVPGTDKLIFTALSAVSTLGTAIFASDLPPRGLTELSAEISEPLFVIYSEKGQGGEAISRQYYHAARGPKELWAAPGGPTGAVDAAPAQYERRVVAFLDRALLAQK